MIFFSGFTEEEREFSQNAILRQQQANHTDTHEDIDEEDEEDLDDTGHGKDSFIFFAFFFTLPRKVLLCPINWGTQWTMEIGSNA